MANSTKTFKRRLDHTSCLAHNWAVHMYEFTRNSRYFGYIMSYW